MTTSRADERTELSAGIGTRIRTRRQDLRISQMTLAMRLGVFQSRICALEHGECSPSAPTLVALARELRCTSDHLLGIASTSPANRHERLP